MHNMALWEDDLNSCGQDGFRRTDERQGTEISDLGGAEEPDLIGESSLQQGHPAHSGALRAGELLTPFSASILPKSYFFFT